MRRFTSLTSAFPVPRCLIRADRRRGEYGVATMARSTRAPACAGHLCTGSHLSCLLDPVASLVVSVLSGWRCRLRLGRSNIFEGRKAYVVRRYLGALVRAPMFSDTGDRNQFVMRRRGEDHRIAKWVAVANKVDVEMDKGSANAADAGRRHSEFRYCWLDVRHLTRIVLMRFSCRPDRSAFYRVDDFEMSALWDTQSRGSVNGMWILPSPICGGFCRRTATSIGYHPRELHAQIFGKSDVYEPPSPAGQSELKTKTPVRRGGPPATRFPDG